MISQQVQSVLSKLPDGVSLVAVSKFHPAQTLQEAYDAGQRDFGESRVQELIQKAPALPQDIRWHFIGPLQRNKVKYIVPFISLIHSLDSPELFAEILKQATKANRQQHCLLEVKVAQEESKTGWSIPAAEAFMAEYSAREEWQKWICIEGIMGIATNTTQEAEIRREFASLHALLQHWQQQYPALPLRTLSMGMSGDWELAVEEGSTMVRIGSAIFGSRGY